MGSSTCWENLQYTSPSRLKPEIYIPLNITNCSRTLAENILNCFQLTTFAILILLAGSPHLEIHSQNAMICGNLKQITNILQSTILIKDFSGLGYFPPYSTRWGGGGGGGGGWNSIGKLRLVFLNMIVIHRLVTIYFFSSFVALWK